MKRLIMKLLTLDFHVVIMKCFGVAKVQTNDNKDVWINLDTTHIVQT